MTSTRSVSHERRFRRPVVAPSLELIGLFDPPGVGPLAINEQWLPVIIAALARLDDWPQGHELIESLVADVVTGPTDPGGGFPGGPVYLD